MDHDGVQSFSASGFSNLRSCGSNWDRNRRRMGLAEDGIVQSNLDGIVGIGIYYCSRMECLGMFRKMICFFLGNPLHIDQALIVQCAGASSEGPLLRSGPANSFPFTFRMPIDPTGGIDTCMN